MSYIFILNPFAGHVNSEEYGKIIEKVCEEKNINDYKIEISGCRGNITEKAKSFADEGGNVIFSIGGDGTVYEAVNGIMQSEKDDAVLVPVPCGSGNDFIRTFGYNAGEDFETLLRRAVDFKVRSIDVMKINDEYGANISSVGFDANVVQGAIKFKKSKFVPNKFAYTLSVFVSFLTQGGYKVKMFADGEKLPYEEVLLVAAANGQYYGGGMQPVPSALIDDGLLDLCIAEKVGKLKILKFFPKYKKGRATEVDVAHLVKCKQLRIESDRELPLNIDGEVSNAKTVVFEICDKKLNVGVLRVKGE